MRLNKLITRVVYPAAESGDAAAELSSKIRVLRTLCN